MNQIFSKHFWFEVGLRVEKAFFFVVWLLSYIPWRIIGRVIRFGYRLVRLCLTPVFFLIRILTWPLHQYLAPWLWAKSRPRFVRWGLLPENPKPPEQSFFKLLILVVKPFFFGSAARQAWWILIAIFALMIANITTSFFLNQMSGKFYSAVLTKDMDKVYWAALMWIGVITLFAPITNLYGTMKTNLQVTMRIWLTSDLVALYLAYRAYMQLNDRPDIDNPDQRMTQDLDGLTGNLVALTISFIDACVSFCTFISVLWFISGKLTWMVIVAALVGTAVQFFIGKALSSWNIRQSKAEGDLRSTVLTIRREAEAVALYNAEDFAKQQAFTATQNVGVTLRGIMWTWFRLNTWSAFYNTGIQLLPLFIVASLFVNGHISDFSAIATAGGAFTAVYNALNWPAGNIGGISSLRAVVTRIGTLKQALIDIGARPLPPGTYIELKEGDTITFNLVTVQSGYLDKKVSVKDLNHTVTKNLALLGPNGAGKKYIMQAVAGLWPFGSGTLTKPQPKDLMFLTRDPYLPLSTLREVLTFSYKVDAEHPVPTDERLQEVLTMVGLQDLAAKVEGFGVQQEWKTLLNLADQQRLSLARIALAKPKYALIDEATSALESEIESMLYTILRTIGTRYIVTGISADIVRYVDEVIELQEDGTWKLYPADQYKKPGWKRFLGL